MENQKIGGLFYWLAALQILIITGGTILTLLIAPASLFVSRTETEAFGWFAAGFAGLIAIALGVILLIFSLVTANAFRRKKSWRKTAGILTAGLAILELPIGTVAGIFLLWKISKNSL